MIVVAGGVGTRMNAGVPKQFLLLAGRPLLMHSIEAFSSAFPEISVILALPNDQFRLWQKLCIQYSFTLPHHLTAGGATRFQSVKNALSEVNGEGLVAIHDGARPLISVALIRNAFLIAAGQGNCIPVIPATESMRILTETGHATQGLTPAITRSLTLQREDVFIVQTPQIFQSAILKKAYEQDFKDSFTDDATVVEEIGETIHLTEGDPVNIKITHPQDLAAAEFILGRG